MTTNIIYYLYLMDKYIKGNNYNAALVINIKRNKLTVATQK